MSSALHVLRSRKVWLIPGALLAVALGLITVLFTGSVADPGADMRDAPIGIVSLDAGAKAGGGTLNLGARVVTGITAQPQHPRKVEWKTYSSLAEVKRQIGRNKLWTAIVLPKDYSARMLSLTGPHPVKPAVTVLTNRGGGAMSTSIGTATARKAATAASAHAAGALVEQARKAGHAVSPANRVLLGDPVVVREQPGAPLGERTGNGMTAFFYALLLTVGGFLSTNLIHAMTDANLGFAATEFGPKRMTALPQPISRLQTLLAKYAVMVGIATVLSSVILAVATFAVHLDLPHSALLWLFGVLSVSAVGIGALTVIAALGSPGIVAALLIFVAAAVPTSGGAIPLQVMPPFWRALASFEPLRAIADGVRAIIYYDAQSDAGLGRALVTLCVGVAVSLLAGLTITSFYDRKGLHRMHPHHLERLRAFLHREQHGAPGHDAEGRHRGSADGDPLPAP
ncbi:SNG1 family protein [Streptomyces sp. LP11]|uniref:SNG1 family protein n=1 Tax=Streptomyces pyxinicus TaxID=2970331 RepID=A0ABT2AYU2_9ACTN|nr:SNG1 family protein [Streptomyces sp. LP11]MCS0601433.1 SNG1 family protein [Streptomyces sp. LP11]